jgi:hypothetical protein
MENGKTTAKEICLVFVFGACLFVGERTKNGSTVIRLQMDF